MLVSVITPTSRGRDALALVEKSLDRQTFQDFEWIVQEKSPHRRGMLWNLNYDYNRAIERSKGELIVSWQDWTYAKPDTLEKFVYHFNQEPETLVTGVGNKYSDDTWSVVMWQDPRKRLDQGTFYPCYFNDVEWNLCSVARKALYSVGGFDEAMDTKFGMDGYSVLDRLNIQGGWDFKIDQTIESFSLEHDRPAQWEEHNWIYEYKPLHERYLKNPVVPYLKSQA